MESWTTSSCCWKEDAVRTGMRDECVTVTHAIIDSSITDLLMPFTHFISTESPSRTQAFLVFKRMITIRRSKRYVLNFIKSNDSRLLMPAPTAFLVLLISPIYRIPVSLGFHPANAFLNFLILIKLNSLITERLKL